MTSESVRIARLEATLVEARARRTEKLLALDDAGSALDEAKAWVEWLETVPEVERDEVWKQGLRDWSRRLADALGRALGASKEFEVAEADVALIEAERLAAHEEAKDALGADEYERLAERAEWHADHMEKSAREAVLLKHVIDRETRQREALERVDALLDHRHDPPRLDPRVLLPDRRRCDSRRPSASRRSPSSRRRATAARAGPRSSDDPEPAGPLALTNLRRALAAVVTAREALDVGDTSFAGAALFELELDIAAFLEEWE
jgi:hypothetical protein